MRKRICPPAFLAYYVRWQNHFRGNFQGCCLLFNCQVPVLLRFYSVKLLYYISLLYSLSRTFFFIFLVLLPCLSDSFVIIPSFFRVVNTFFKKLLLILLSKRRRRDLNPRTAINDLLPFQGSPFSHLGTSPKPVLLRKKTT